MENPTELAYIRNKLRSINNITTVSGSTASGTVGLNVYQIYPTTIIYPLTGAFIGGTNPSGVVSNSAPYQFLGAGALYFSWRDSTAGGPFNIGRNYSRNFYIYTTANVGTKYVDVEYINASGDLVFQQDISINNNNTVPASLNVSAININRLTWTDRVENTNLGTVHVIADSNTEGGNGTVRVYRNSIVPAATAYGVPGVSLGTFTGGTSVITIPNGYVGVISDVYMASNNLTATPLGIQMIVKDKRNKIKYVRYCKTVQQYSGSNYILTYESFGPWNHPLEPGDNVFFGAVDGQANYNILIIVNAIVTLTAI